MKKFTAILLTIIMLFTVLPLTVFAETDTGYIECTSAEKHHTFSGNAKLDSHSNRLLLCETCKQLSTAKTGDYYMYGTYPQSEVTETALKATLIELAGSTDKWISYKYYSGTGKGNDGNMTAKDYMKYKDVTYDGEIYRGVYFTEYRDASTGSTPKVNKQESNGYSTSTQYWFSFDSIKWRVLDPSTGLVIAETILDSQAYNNYLLYSSSEYYGDASKSYYANNWEHSSIRKWLNNDFLTTAFSTEEQNNIKETTLSTPAYSTSYSKYDSADTLDKVFLLSYTEVQNTVYGFVNGRENFDTRIAQGSSYAKCQGLYVYSGNGNSWWRLRSGGTDSFDSCCVNFNGRVFINCYPNDTDFGIRPAMYLQIPYEVSVTYKLGEGDWADGYTAPAIYLSNNIILPTADKIVRDGYTFKGWELTTDTATVKEYTAQWEKIPDDTSSGGVRMFYWLKWLLEYMNKLMSKMFDLLGWAY